MASISFSCQLILHFHATTTSFSCHFSFSCNSYFRFMPLMFFIFMPLLLGFLLYFHANSFHAIATSGSCRYCSSFSHHIHLYCRAVATSGSCHYFIFMPLHHRFFSQFQATVLLHQFHAIYPFSCCFFVFQSLLQEKSEK